MKIETRNNNSLTVPADRKDTSYLDIETTATTTTACDESDGPQAPLTDKVQIEFGIPEIYLYDNMCSAADEDEGNHFNACTPGAGTPSNLFAGADWLLAKANISQGEQSTQKLDDDSVGSVNSVTYFEPADFNRSNWESVINAPTMGLAFVGIAMALTHPLLFVAGLLTAVGTATAASRGYDCVEKGMYSQIWMSLFDSSGDSKETSESASAPIENGIPRMKKEHQDDSTAEISDESDDNQKSVDGRKTNAFKILPRKTPPLPPSGQATTITLDHIGLTPDWLAGNFTDLKHHIVTDREFVGLNVIEFIRVFFGDDAPYSFKEFQKKRGDLDINYGNWTDEVAKGPLSLHPPPGAGDFPFDTTPYLSYRTRSLKFRAKTNNSNLLGPAFATTTKVQRLLLISKRFAVIEMKTTLRDIPFADRFFVLERWVLKAEKDDHGLYTIFLSVSTGVVFTGTCPFESPIRTRSAAAVSDVINAWCAMASEVLKLTEETKKSRLDHRGDQHGDCDLITVHDLESSCAYQDEGELSVEMNIDDYLGAENNRSLKRTVSDSLEDTRRRSFIGLGRSLSQIITRGQKESPSKNTSRQEV